MDQEQDPRSEQMRQAAESDETSGRTAPEELGGSGHETHESGMEESRGGQQQMIDELELERARAAEYLEQAQRTRAEMINYRRRMEQEMDQVRRHAGERVIARLLPVVDDFHRALGAVPEDERDNAWIQGLILIERKLWSVLESEGVQPIEAVGKPFDPSVHEAVTVDGDGGAEVVVEEFQRGYTLHDRIIRPAMVKVGKAKPAANDVQA
jgi:molecular chaperone GrpE